MRKDRPIPQASSLSCLPSPPKPSSSEPHLVLDPATPEEDQPETTKPFQTPPPSISAFFAAIGGFLEGDYCSGQGQSLVLEHVAPSRFNCFQDWVQKRNKHLRYAYDEPLRTLTLRAMPTAVHEVLITWLTGVVNNLRTILSTEEKSRSRVSLVGSRNVGLRSGSVRQPDAAFFSARLAADGRWQRDPFPRVVFEVAFKQRYKEVVEVARQWLTGSGGRVVVVVVVNIEEGAIAAGGAEEEEEKEKVVEDKDEDKEGEERFSSPSHLEEFHKSCHSDTSQWVGPLTATIELFRLSGTEMVRDGHKYNMLPRTPEPDPVLRIADLMPGCAADDHRVVPLPLEPYREELDMAVTDLALARKAAVHTARKRARGEEAGFDGAEFEQQEQEEEGRDMKRVRVLRSGAGGAGM